MKIIKVVRKADAVPDEVAQKRYDELKKKVMYRGTSGISISAGTFDGLRTGCDITSSRTGDNVILDGSYWSNDYDVSKRNRPSGFHIALDLNDDKVVEKAAAEVSKVRDVIKAWLKGNKQEITSWKKGPVLR